MNAIRLIDTHCHWDQLPSEEMEVIIRRARRAGVSKVLAVATDEESCLRLLQWRQRFPDFVEVAFGLHPEQSWKWCDVDAVMRLIRQYRSLIRAVGEIGMAHYSLAESARSQAPSREEAAMLDRFLRLAVELDLPVSLHAVHRRAEVVFRSLRQLGVRRAVFHWLKASDDLVEEIIRAGYAVSVTPEVSYRQRDRRLAAKIPLSSLLLETDAPWPYRGQPSEPAEVRRVAEAVSQVKGVPLTQVAAVTTAHAEKLFNIRC